MATLHDASKIAAKLPGSLEAEDGMGFSVMVKGKAKGYAWAWAERVHPKQAKVRNPGVLAIMVPNLTVKEMILGSDSNKFFTEPHYNGFPAVLVRLEAVDSEELEDLLVEAWRSKASPDLRREYESKLSGS